MTTPHGPTSPDQLGTVEAELWRAAAEDRIASLADLGGMTRILVDAAALTTSPLLPEFARSVAAEPTTSADLVDAVRLVADGVAGTASLSVLRETTDILIGAPGLLALCAEQLSEICLERVKNRTSSPPALAGTALEVAVRLALGGWVPEYDVLGVLVRLNTIEPYQLARSAVRCLGAAYDEWRDARLVTALKRLAGLYNGDEGTSGEGVSVAARNDVARIGPDAAFELGQCALGAALTAPSCEAALPDLTDAYRMFSAAREDEDRPDARLMAGAVGVLTAYLGHPVGTTTNADDIAEVDEAARELVAGHIGFATDWRAPRLEAEVAWAQLARDLVTTQRDIAADSWYDAARVTERVLAVYTASRTSMVLRASDTAGIRSLLAPRIAHGIGTRAALLRHLQDHITALENRLDADDSGDTDRQLDAARQLLAAAGNIAAHGVVRPKEDCDPGHAATAADAAASYPALTGLLADQTTALMTIASTNSDAAGRIELALRDAQAANDTPHIESIVFTETYNRLRTPLLQCPDYRSDVKAAVDELIQLLIRYQRDRGQRSQSRAPFLFKPDASEKDLATDLEGFLATSVLSSYAHTEVRDIGGGWVDIAIFYCRFTLVIELKQDDTDVSPTGLGAYLSQIATYSGSDVTIGYLVVLDLRPNQGPALDIRSSSFVVAVDDVRLGRPRYVMTFLIEGNRRHPSSMKPVGATVLTNP